MTLTPNQNTTARVKQALTANGYGHEDIRSAQFVEQAGHNEVHAITYLDINTGRLATGNVYLYFANGKLVGEF